MNVMLVGGDGFCGWPTSLRLASEGHLVKIVDNLSRRSSQGFMAGVSLTPIASIENRISNSFPEKISFENLDARDQAGLTRVMRDFRPSVVIHMAEQRSAPYSMQSSANRMSTIDHNIKASQVILEAMIDMEERPSLVHIGTMGVYGYEHLGKVKENENIRNPGSIYHLTKVLDHELFRFYAKNWGLKVIDLHQGIVWGTQTPLTLLNQHTLNRVDYDGEFGTVLNRFVIQAVGGLPLSVYGSGNQERAFIHITDAVECVAWAVRHSQEMKSGQVIVKNQFSEIKKLNELSQLVKNLSGVDIHHVENPRLENEKNSLNAETTIPYLQTGKVLKIGISELRNEMDFVKGYINNLNSGLLKSKSFWTETR